MGPDDALRADGNADETAPTAELKLGKPEPDELNWVFFGSHGLRAGWSLLIFGAAALLSTRPLPGDSLRSWLWTSRTCTSTAARRSTPFLARESGSRR